MKQTTYLLTLLLLSLSTFAMGFTPPSNTEKTETIQWMSVEEAFVASQKNPKKLFIDIYTDWCGWCKRLDSQTFSDPAIVKMMNDNYYPVKLDGEGKEDIILGGQKFSFVNEGQKGYHQLAAALMQGQMSYPTMVIYDFQANSGQSIVGFKDAPALKAILEQDLLALKPIPKQEPAQASIKEIVQAAGSSEVSTNEANASDKIKWLTMEEAYKAMQKKPKKLIIDVYTDWCGWCKKMDQNTFADPAIAKYVNENFYAVKLDAQQTEDIQLGDQTFVYTAGPDGKKGYHQLAQVLLKNKLSFPTIVMAGDDLSFYHPYGGYRDVPQMKEILDFYVQDKHLQKPDTGGN